MPTESNTGSDLGPNATKRTALKIQEKNQTRYMVPAETPRERMARIVKTVRNKPKVRNKRKK